MANSSSSKSPIPRGRSRVGSAAIASPSTSGRRLALAGVDVADVAGAQRLADEQEDVRGPDTEPLAPVGRLELEVDVLAWIVGDVAPDLAGRRRPEDHRAEGAGAAHAVLLALVLVGDRVGADAAGADAGLEGLEHAAAGRISGQRLERGAALVEDLAARVQHVVVGRRLEHAAAAQEVPAPARTARPDLLLAVEHRLHHRVLAVPEADRVARAQRLDGGLAGRAGAARRLGLRAGVGLGTLAQRRAARAAEHRVARQAEADQDVDDHEGFHVTLLLVLPARHARAGNAFVE